MTSKLPYQSPEIKVASFRVEHGFLFSSNSMIIQQESDHFLLQSTDADGRNQQYESSDWSGYWDNSNSQQ